MGAAHTDRPSDLAAAGLEAVLAAQSSKHPGERGDRIAAAVVAADELHEGQLRRSGDPYISHPLQVAELVADWGLDEASIVAALLHDVVEDTHATLDDIRALFAEDPGFADEVARLVDGLTKLDGLKLGGVAGAPQRAAAQTLSKLLLAMADDVRVLVIKLADRLHNVRTLDALPAAKAARIARETMDVYAPLAHRMGIGHVSSELEDRCFAVLWPERYAELSELVRQRVGRREQWMGAVQDEIGAMLSEAGLPAAVSSRGKHLWSVYEKMVNKGRELDQIFDLVGVRVMVDTVAQCYSALGVIHSLYQPVPSRLKDFISSPKHNLYQSLHTTVIAPNGAPVEVQIRTVEMHHRSEWGVAAHWRYKDDAGNDRLELAPDWLRQLGELGDGGEPDPAAFLEQLRRDLTAEEIYCFTPDGDVVALPSDATPVDFAYAIHTEVGHTCQGARINGRMVPLSHTLSSGDRVEIITGRLGGPNPDWLRFAVSARARARIRQFAARSRRARAAEDGRVALVEAMSEAGVPVRIQRLDGIEDAAAQLGHPSSESLLAAVGERKVPAEQVARRLIERTAAPPARPGRKRRHKRLVRSWRVNVEGLDGVAVRLARCCNPVPGDQIAGYLSGGLAGRRVVVHRESCEEAVRGHVGQQPLEVAWVGDGGAALAVIEVEALDRAGLLADQSRSITDAGGNIQSSATSTGRDMVARARFEVLVSGSEGVDVILAALRALPGVYTAVRAAS